MYKEGRSLVIGLILILLGFLFLANNLNWVEFSWGTWWPYLVILAGFLFWVQWIFNRENYGVLMPGTTLLIYGLLFVYCVNNGWSNMEYLWPVFILGPGLGFFAMYLLGTREGRLLTTSLILIGLSLVFFIGWDRSELFWPIILIIIGIILLFKARKRASFSTPHVSNAGVNDANDLPEK